MYLCNPYVWRGSLKPAGPPSVHLADPITQTLHFSRCCLPLTTPSHLGGSTCYWRYASCPSWPPLGYLCQYWAGVHVQICICESSRAPQYTVVRFKTTPQNFTSYQLAKEEKKTATSHLLLTYQTLSMLSSQSQPSASTQNCAGHQNTNGLASESICIYIYKPAARPLAQWLAALLTRATAAWNSKLFTDPSEASTPTVCPPWSFLPTHTPDFLMYSSKPFVGSDAICLHAGHDAAHLFL